MYYFDNWYDIWRLGNLIIGLLCFIWLMGGYKRQQEQWNVKTRDLWYSRVVWAVVQISASVEGIRNNYDLTATLMLITVAGLVTFKGLATRGAWGYKPNA